jgi:hypothetical protein
LLLGAGPRTTIPCQLTPFAVHDTAADTADFDPVDARALDRWLDSAGSLDGAANTGPPVDTKNCNNVFGDAAARIAVRIP